MNTANFITMAANQIQTLSGHVFDLLDITKPTSIQSAVNLAKIISKLSPLLGNSIEYNTVELLNEIEAFKPHGLWVRQDPGFPDTVFQGSITPTPGFEIKAWFPLATEITARFKDSQNHFFDRNTYVALLAWIPEFVIYGRPRIISVCIIEGGSIARARDIHYHNPPDYLVIEPNDTSARTGNLQQTNTMGLKWQGTDEQFEEAKMIVDGWGLAGRNYQPTHAYQTLVRELLGRYNYRLDTNFAKIDRISHPEIETFKRNTLAMPFHGLTIGQWSKVCNSKRDDEIRRVFEEHLTITDVDTRDLLK